MVTWKNHGGFEKVDAQTLIAQASAIAIGRLNLVSQEPVEYSTGDARLPIVWKITVSFQLHERVCGVLPDPLLIEGRSRPSHPDRLVEDYFWAEWQSDQDYILFLQGNTVLGIEPAASELRLLLHAMIGNSGRCPSEDI